MSPTFRNSTIKCFALLFASTVKSGEIDLNHVHTYVEELGNEETGEWELGTWLERWKLAEKIKADIRPKLIQTLLRDDLDEDEAQDFVEEMVDRQL
jgi:hypothetical protein